MDLSLESTYGLAPMIAAWLIVPVAAFGNGLLLNPYLGIVILLAVGAAVGLANGLLIVKGRLNGFIVTLGMTILLAGIQDGIVKGAGPVQPADRVRLPRRGRLRRGPGVADRRRGHLRRSPGSSCAITGSAGRSTRSAATARRPAPPGSRWTRSGSASTWPAASLAAIGGLMEAGRVSSVAPTAGLRRGHHLPGLRRGGDRRRVACRAAGATWSAPRPA